MPKFPVFVENTLAVNGFHDEGKDEKREQGGRDQTADDDDGKRPLAFAAYAVTQGCG